MSIRSILTGAVLAAGLAAALPALAADEDPVVATVNGEKITRSELMEAHQNLPQEYQGIPFQQIYPMLLTTYIDSKLVTADAEARKLDEEEAFQERLASVKAQLLERYAIGKVIEGALTEEKLRARYDAQAAEGAEEVHARHILLKTQDDAVAVIKELDGGADFAELAKSKSTGPSAPRGGDLGFFGKGQMVPPFEEAAFALDAGSYSKEPVQTQFGYHVILVEARRDAAPPSFEQSVEQLREQAAQEAGTAYIETLREKATIERFNPDGSKQQ